MFQTPQPASPEFQEKYRHFARISLESFLTSSARLEFPKSNRPRISLILVLYNQAELTLQCLKTLALDRSIDWELILVNNASQDTTIELLNRLDNVHIIDNKTNRGFGEAVNQAAERAQGEYLLLLNNDTQWIGQNLKFAVDCMAADSDIGVLGAKVLLADGTLQEAGCVLWNEGSTYHYGRHENGLDAEFQAVREVPYVSGVFLLTRKVLFEKLKGFDPLYYPAYYEDVDYCVRCWKAGYKVVYRPELILSHFESASAKSEEVLKWVRWRKTIFQETHQKWLETRPPADLTKVQLTRTESLKDSQIILLTETLPSSWRRSDDCHLIDLLKTIDKKMNEILLLPTRDRADLATLDKATFWHEAYQEIPREVEILPSSAIYSLSDFLHFRPAKKRILWVYGKQSARMLDVMLKKDSDSLNQISITYLSKPSEDVSPYSSEDYKITSELKEIDFQKLVPFQQRAKGLLFSGAMYPGSTELRQWKWLQSILGAEFKNFFTSFSLEIITTDVASHPGTVQNLRSSLHEVNRYHQWLNVLGNAKFGVFPSPDCKSAWPWAVLCVRHHIPLIVHSELASILNFTAEREVLVANNVDELEDACQRLISDQQLWERLISNSFQRICHKHSAKAA
ncbi:Hypothetical protein PBC10988_35640 [Planctomycetales bacterium 10988]|nr:Hypothetical protein PBC10988_35640 [Planctomycetales bacterium 10988]